MHSLIKTILPNQQFIGERASFSFLPICLTPQDRQLFPYLNSNDSFQRELGGQNIGWGQIFQVSYHAFLWMETPRNSHVCVSLHDQSTSRTLCVWGAGMLPMETAKLSLAIFKSLDSYSLPTYSLDLIYLQPYRYKWRLFKRINRPLAPSWECHQRAPENHNTVSLALL